MPDNVTDAAAVFAEPLAAACRILEQGLVPPEARAAVLGDGKLGLLIAEVFARRAVSSATKDSADTGGSSASTSPPPPPTNANVVVEDENSGGSAGNDGCRPRPRPGSTTIIGRHREKMEMCCSGLGRGGEDGGESARKGDGEQAGFGVTSFFFSIVCPTLT